MSVRQKTSMKISGGTLKILEPVHHPSTAPFRISRRSQSEALPSIAGVAFGVQDVRASGSMLGKKTTKIVPIDIKYDKALSSVSTQTASDGENAHLEKIRMLQKENIELKAKIKERDAAISNFHQIIQDKNAEYVRAMETEKNCHKVTQKQLEESQKLVQEKVQLLNESTEHYEKLTQELQLQHERALTAIKTQSQADISHRDETIAKLKSQISDLFKEKSREHQQQLEELRKEVNRLAEEAHILRIKLKREEIYKQLFHMKETCVAHPHHYMGWACFHKPLGLFSLRDQDQATVCSQKEKLLKI